MKRIIVKDNSFISKEDLSDVSNIVDRVADKTLEKLQADGLFILPEVLADSDNLDRKQMVLESNDEQYVTSNLMGFIGAGEQRLVISSRFSTGDEDFFFQYLLEKVIGCPNVLNMDSNGNANDKYFDIIVFMFPYYLRAAMRKGPYKTYILNKYNDSNVKGTIDVARHIRQNTPFVGNIAYNQREHSFDNHLMELVRHTIEFIKGKPFGRKILDSVKDEVGLVVGSTPNYKVADRRKVIVDNEKNVVAHTYYHEYRILQKLCLLILKNYKHQVGIGSERLFGIIFDGAWLWEEYINTLIRDSFYHPMNKVRIGNQYLFAGGVGKIYPDFIGKDSDNRVIADAKYKPMNNISGDDYLQVLAYMFRFDAKCGLYLYPETSYSSEKVLMLNKGTSYEKNVKPRQDISVVKIGLSIPQDAADYSVFKSRMKENESEFIGRII